MRIGIDLMGGDNPPELLFHAVLKVASEARSNCTFVIIATHATIALLKNHPISKDSSIKFHPVSDAIMMSEEPLRAVKRKTGSSLVTGIRLLKRQKIDAFVSAGNTGALIASATLHLPHLPGIKRPALLINIPTHSGSLSIMDVGGTVSSKALHLLQFAKMGVAFQHSKGNPRPKVGLLNIGIEPKKGTSLVQQAHQLIDDYSKTTSEMEFVGNVEARDLFQGDIDVVISDGFTGNVFLKTTEGLSAFFLEETSKLFEKEKRGLQTLKSLFNYQGYPGAILCGVEGVVIKCHGNATAEALYHSIVAAMQAVSGNLIQKLKQELTKP